MDAPLDLTVREKFVVDPNCKMRRNRLRKLEERTRGDVGREFVNMAVDMSACKLSPKFVKQRMRILMNEFGTKMCGIIDM